MPNVESKGAPKGGRKLTKSLIAQRNLHIPIKIDAPENIWQALASLQVLRLDREGIGYIPNLQGLEHIHSIYLQQNQIEKIENLKCFSNLKFLTLAGNCISKVENLKDLLKLQFLDLSQNNIQILDIDELPHSLVILDLTGNKCTDQKNYRECVLDALPHLRELDRQRVPSRKVAVQDKKEEEEDSEDSDVDDCPELFQPLSAEKGLVMAEAEDDFTPFLKLPAELRLSPRSDDSHDVHPVPSAECGVPQLLEGTLCAPTDSICQCRSHCACRASKHVLDDTGSK
uniref:Leucine rich repeat containing 46 n=1 Tax=Salvator merianae TaxID=96440 RepID=A0A8D0AWP6_SALMN